MSPVAMKLYAIDMIQPNPKNDIFSTVVKELGDHVVA
jgi:hypothetical protein